jgi:hypothetical protein
MSHARDAATLRFAHQPGVSPYFNRMCVPGKRNGVSTGSGSDRVCLQGSESLVDSIIGKHSVTRSLSLPVLTSSLHLLKKLMALTLCRRLASDTTRKMN